MSKPSLYALVVAAITFLTMGCGMSDSSNRVLDSISVTPATASADSSTAGQVQFTASGSFSKPPSPAPVPFIAPYSGGWETSDPAIASISIAGVTQCLASGTVTVTAQASANKASGTGATGVGVRGTAQLTCQ